MIVGVGCVEMLFDRSKQNIRRGFSLWSDEYIVDLSGGGGDDFAKEVVLFLVLYGEGSEFHGDGRIAFAWSIASALKAAERKASS